MRLRLTALLWLAVALSLVASRQSSRSAARDKPMSVSNRILLNRHAVIGRNTLDVMLITQRSPSSFDRVLTAVGRFGGRAKREERAIDYLRAEIPIEKLIDLVSTDDVEAYQISSLSKGSWYRDGPPEDNARMFWERETDPPVVISQRTARPDLPPLSALAARDTAYTAEDDTGVAEWLRDHPTYDGRGVTIAILESGQAEFTHPTLGIAKTLDGRDVPKLAGIINATDPDEPDWTRIELDARIRAASTWQRVGHQTYILPRAGAYHFGLFPVFEGNNVAQQFGVLRHDETGEVWVDTNGNRSFQDERPIADVNARLDVRRLQLQYPHKLDLPFVVAAASRPNRIHIYLARDGHQSMVFSVAAGSQTDDGLASGVASNARVILVQNYAGEVRLHDIAESFIDASKHPEVDVLSNSSGLTLVPDATGDFSAIFLERLMTTYRKPIFLGAGNKQLAFATSTAAGFAVGGSLSPSTFAAFYGGGTLSATIVHPISASGPELGGAIKPDFLAPMHKLSAEIRSSAGIPVPKDDPKMQLPPGYGISCCTSSTAPYAAGFAALLVSAAKQEHLDYSIQTFERALRVGSTFLEGWPAHQQGNGLLNIARAWKELRPLADVPAIEVIAPNSHALTGYARSGGKGVGLFELDGWQVGSKGQRMFDFTRESGPSHPVHYRLDWTGNDGTFSTGSSIVLPINQTVSLPVDVSVSSPGAHSAILNLRDGATGAIVHRSLATVVTTAHLNEPDWSARFNGSVGMMRMAQHHVTIPQGVAALDVELEVLNGSAEVMVLPAVGLNREYYTHVLPGAGRMFTPGRYRLLMPWPAAGPWSVAIHNRSVRNARNPADVSADDVVYRVTARALTASIQQRQGSDASLRFGIKNQAARLEQPVLETSSGTLRSHRGEFRSNALPNRFDIDVPDGADTLLLQLRGAAADSPPLELHLYDCTSGECFSYDFTVPAAMRQTMEVRKPKAGRWIAAVNSAPSPAASGSFVLDEIISSGTRRTSVSESIVPMPRQQRSDARPVLLCELIDAAAERDAKEHPWENRKPLTNFGERTVAAGVAVIPLK